jgi:hypothetical protein
MDAGASETNIPKREATTVKMTSKGQPESVRPTRGADRANKQRDFGLDWYLAGMAGRWRKRERETI